MHKITGACHCGNVLIDLELTKEPGAYHPRACDCDFCRKHSAAYLSDAQGSLRVRIKEERDAQKYRQGNELADFLLCRNCGVLIGVFHRSDGHVFAAVNAKAIDAAVIFGAEQPVSPKRLSADEKVGRWRELWFSNVSMV